MSDIKPRRLSDIAKALEVHPRTVLRAVLRRTNPYWTEDFDPHVDMIDVALSFDANPHVLNRVMDGKDDLFTPAQAIQYLADTYGDHIVPRTLRNRDYPKAVKLGRIVRYSRIELSEYHFNTQEL
jgi:hypothetical protein